MQIKIRRLKDRRIGFFLNKELKDKVQGYKDEDRYTVSKLIRGAVYDIIDGKMEQPPVYESEDSKVVTTFVLRLTTPRYEQMIQFIEDNNYKSVNKFIRSVVVHSLPEIKRKYEIDTN